VASDPLGHVWPAGLDGMFVVGVFTGVEEQPGQNGYGPSSQIVLERRLWNGETFRMSYLFDAYDQDTGERTRCAEEVAKISPGELVAVRVKGAASRKSGKPWYKALGCARLDVAV